jgi:hypothetical protein
VRCAACGHTWRARASDITDGASQGDEAELEAALDAPDENVALEEEADHHAGLPLAPGAPNMRGAILGWAGAGAGLLALMALAVVFRVEIVGLWPKMASAYAAAGFEVTAEGLVFENPEAAPGYTEGEPTLTITAVIRNTSGRIREVPPVWIGLFDEDGEEVFSWSVALEVAELHPREAARFTAMLAQPPAEAEDLELRFLRGEPEGEPVPAATEIVDESGTHEAGGA